MRLTRVELSGFKSFAERTSFDIGRGTTCFVGPNGCGKSNMVDALKWALGEQRPTSLRGDAMIDVIFKGNQSRPGAPFAEVALTFSNDDGKIALDMAEVAVSRKLNRSGESEYYLNGELCRLKDIKTLLMDTGVGLTAYSFMEQGRIDALLSSSAIERRSVFEEAAGISKYRLRRQETLRKLERVDQDLLRVSDIIAELERQSRSLKQQAGRARSYQQYQERLKILLAAHLHHEYQALMAEREVLVRECNARGEVEAALRAKVAELEARTRAAEETETRLNEELSSKRSAMADRKARSDAAERRIADLKARQVEFEEALAEAGEREQSIRQGVLAKEAERATLAESLSTQRAQEKDLAMQLLAVRAEEEALDAQARELRSRIEPIARERIQLADRQTQLKRQGFELGSALDGFGKQRRKGLQKQQEFAALIAERARELSVLRAELAVHERHHGELVEQLERCRAARATAEERGTALKLRFDQTRAEVQALESRRDLLAHSLQEFEGVDEGVRVLLKARAEGGADSIPRIRGLLADLVAVDVEHSRAVEAALGSYAQAVLVDRLDDVRVALAFLKQRGVGKVTFLPLLDILTLAPRRTEFPFARGERLIDCLVFDPGLWPLFEWLVGDVALVDQEDLLGAESDGRWRRVTRDGDLRTPHGAVDGVGKRSGAGLIARRSELDELSVRAHRGRGDLEQLAAELAQHDERTTLLRAEIEVLSSRASQVSAQLHEVERKVRSVSERAALQRGELRVGLAELLALERDHSDIASRLGANQREEHAVNVAIEERTREQTRLESEAQKLAESRPALREERSRLELDLARLREWLTSLARQLQSLETSLEEGRAELARLERQSQDLELRRSAAVEEVESLGEALLVLQVERARLAEDLAGAQANQERVRAELTTARDEARAEREHFARVVEDGRDVQLREQKNGLLLASLKEKALGELGVEIEAITADTAQAFEDWQAVEAEVQDLKLKMQRLGSVNLEAIEELTQIDQRLEFMTKERDDLIQAQKSLKQMIAEMDEESRTRFASTFAAVREHFQTIFRQLFRGGHADLILTEGADILDAGVEVVAAPPGKKQQTITLLSGGERTLTAVGLLFSLFKLRPSPICVLDEVDAALDETNVERFCSMLNDYEASTQFLIVTHSKRTMARAEVLYGITMEGDGISRPIAIRLNEYQDKVA